MKHGANSVGARNVNHVVHGYGNLAALEETPPLAITSADGVYVVDEAGKRYIEGASGMWCASFGFSEQALIDAAIEQFRKLPYYHNLIDKTTAPMGELAERLKAMAPAPMSKVFFANSGSEANDTLIKIAWCYNNARGRPEKKKIISRHYGFHGVTVGAASMSGIPAIHADFDLPLPGFLHTDMPHYYRYAHAGESEEDYASRLADDLEQLIEHEGPQTIAAFIAEPVMGAGGCIVPPRTYFTKIQSILERHAILFFADEVICGFGRTGNMFGCETYDIKPHALTVAKGLSSAYQPISAILINEDIYQALLSHSRKAGYFAHAFTTTGHPVAVAVALRAQQLMEERDILNHVRRVSPILQDGLRAFAEHPLVGDVRGVGLMGAVELVADKGSKQSFNPELKVKDHLRLIAQDHGLIIRSALAGDSIAFSPPLIIAENEIEELLARFAHALDETTKWVEHNGYRQ